MKHFIFNTGDYALQVMACDSRRNILQQLKAKNGSLIIEKDEEYASGGYLIVCRSAGTELRNRLRRIGLIRSETLRLLCNIS